MTDTDILNAQAEHLDELLKEKGYSQVKFAMEFEFSKSSVNEWIKGKRHMGDDAARRITRKWPEYPIDWLRGYVLGKTPKENFAKTLDKANRETEMMFEAVGCLARLNGYETNSPFYDADSIEGMVDAIKCQFVTFSKGGNTISLSMDDCYELCNEFVDYAGMRLDRLAKSNRLVKASSAQSGDLGIADTDAMREEVDNGKR